MKLKIDALGWHARCLPLLKNTQVVDALALFKRALLPADNAAVRNAYLTSTDHNSNAMVAIAAIIKAESLQEKMTVGNPSSMRQSAQNNSSSAFRQPYDRDLTEAETSNANVQRRLFQLFTIAEPLLINQGNVIEAVSNQFVENLGEILIFQSSNLLNIQKKINLNSISSEDIQTPQYLKVLMRCLSSVLRYEATIEILLSNMNCRPLMAIATILRFAREEEMAANGLKVIRYCLKEDNHHQKTILEFPDMINQLICNVYVNFDHSQFVNGEMKNIMNYFTRKQEYVYLIKPDALHVLGKHPSGIMNQFPVLKEIIQYKGEA